MTHPVDPSVPRTVPRVIVLDGPEKAGKTTLANAIVTEARRLGIRVHCGHWGKLYGDEDADKQYAEMLKVHLNVGRQDLYVWDRSWASEAVYGMFYNRKRRLAQNWWLGEWLYGRAVQMLGTRVMVLGPDAEELIIRRQKANDTNDLDINPRVERRMFEAYAETFGWYVTRELANTNWVVGKLLNFGFVDGEKLEWRDTVRSYVDPRDVCGDPRGRVVVVGERPSDAPPPPGAWLPFSTKFTEMYGAALGNLAFRCTWTNMSVDPARWVRDASCVIACGQLAQEYCGLLIDVKKTTYVKVPHPAAVYRWGRYKDQREQYEQDIVSTVRYSLGLAPAALV